MKKISLFILGVFLSFGYFLASCSSDYDDACGKSEEVRLAETKSLILSLGQKYGLTNILFNDELLKKHLDMSKEEFENNVILMAVSMRKIDGDHRQVKKVRRRVMGQNENGGNEVYYIQGAQNVSGDKDTLFRYKFEMIYYYDNCGLISIDPAYNSADVYSIHSCGSPYCKDLHHFHEQGMGDYAVCTSTNSHPADVNGSIVGKEGEIVHIGIPYNVNITYERDSLNGNTSLKGTLNVTETVHKR